MSGDSGASSGLLLVDKPAGVTSHDVVQRVRKVLLRENPLWDPRKQPGARRRAGAPRPPRFKCGHAGTLDPLATGLLLILIGKASRLAPFLMGHDKVYQATIGFGALTDTLDADGVIIDRAPVPADPRRIQDNFPLFTGAIQQVPPAVSALKFKGQPLYKLVRQGKPLPELKARPVTIHRLEMAGCRWAEAEMDLVVECSSGTYVRSLARDLAQAGGTQGHIRSLRRLKIGSFTVNQALDHIMERSAADLIAAMKPLVAALPEAPRLSVDASQAAGLRQGMQPEAIGLASPDKSAFQGTHGESIFRLVGSDDELVAVARADTPSGELRTAVVIPADLEASGPCA